MSLIFTLVVVCQHEFLSVNLMISVGLQSLLEESLAICDKELGISETSFSTSTSPTTQTLNS